MRRARAFLSVLLLAGLVPSASVAAHHDGARLFGAAPVGDIDGDDVPDLLVVSRRPPPPALPPSPEDATAPLGLAMIEGVSGADGGVLWRHEELGAGFWHAFGPVGDGTPGVIVHVARHYEATSDYEFVALAQDGSVVWRYGVDAPAHVLGGESVHPWDGGDVLPGAGYDPIALRTRSGGAHLGVGGEGEGWDVIDGGDGTLGARIEDGEPFLSVPWPGPDLTGDGTREIIRIGSEDEGGRFAEALAGPDLTPLWRLDMPSGMRADVPRAIGDVTGDGTKDLALVSIGDGVTYVLDGGTGGIRFDAPFPEVEALGDVDGDGAGELLFVKRGFGSPEIQYRATTGTGEILYERTWAVSVPSGATVTSSRTIPAGDVNGDRVTDVYQELVATRDQSVVAAASGMLDGATGTLLWDAGTLQGIQPTAALDGEGPDVFDIECIGGQIIVRAMAGDSGDTLWEKAAPAPCTGSSFGTPDLTDDGVPDLVLGRSGGGGDSALQAFSGADGSLLWSV